MAAATESPVVPGGTYRLGGEPTVAVMDDGVMVVMSTESTSLYFS
jgi:hypothetical protein